MGKLLRLSRFVHSFDVEDSIALFHSINIDILFVPNTARGIISELQQVMQKTDLEDIFGQRQLSQLIKRGFIIAQNYDEVGEIERLVEKDVLGVYLHTIYLLLSEPCNLQCGYCFFEDQMPQKRLGDRYMREATVKNALDCFATWATPKQPATVLLYGGDPLMNMPALRYAIAYTDELSKSRLLHPESSVAVVCNGTLIGKDFADFVGQYKDRVSLSVSLDGPWELHDKWRVDGRGKGTYTRALAGYRLAQEVGLKPAISCTLPPDNLSEIDKIIDWLIELRPNGMSFNMMTDTSVIHVDGTYASNATSAMIEAFIRLREAGIYEDRLMRKVGSFIDGKRFYKDCAGYGEQLVIAPDGQIGPCHAFTADRKYFGANVNDPGDFNPSTDPTLLEWSRRSPLTMPQCHDCAALGICGGGCAANAENRHGSFWAIDDQFCIHARQVLAWMIAELYQNSKS